MDLLTHIISLILAFTSVGAESEGTDESAPVYGPELATTQSQHRTASLVGTDVDARDVRPSHNPPDFGLPDVGRLADFVDSGQVHVVDAGDYLYSIARNYECTVSEIALANGINEDVIFEGDVLTIPVCGGSTGRSVGYRVRSGDNIGHIADRNDCTVEELIQANGIVDGLVRVGERLEIPDSCTDSPFSTNLHRDINEDRLPTILAEMETRIPRDFRAYIVAIETNEDRTEIFEERRYDFAGTSQNASDWVPASTVKIYAAIAAMQRARAAGFSPAANVTFDDQHSATLSELVVEAIGPSNNIAYDFLVAFAGFDYLHDSFFTADNGFGETELTRSYETSVWMGIGMSPSLRYSPSILVEQDGYFLSTDAEVGHAYVACRTSSCTSLEDLGETMRRVMMQEALDTEDGFNLHRDDLRLLRETMATTRSRGEEVVTALRPMFSDGTTFYHKAGFAADWYSDNVFIDDPDRNTVYVVTLAADGGRDSLDPVLPSIAWLLASGSL